MMVPAADVEASVPAFISNLMLPSGTGTPIAGLGRVLSWQMLRSRLGFAQELFQVIRSEAPIARRETGKAIWSQLTEMIRLRQGVGRLDPDEYYHYLLYDDRRFTWQQKQQFFGRRMENGLIPILIEEGWIGLANDKAIAYAFLHGSGFPIPEIYAAYHAFRGCGRIPVLRTAAALADFIRTNTRPFVAKPIFGISGRGVSAVREYDQNRDAVVLTNGTIVDLDTFVSGFNDLRMKGGVLLQELLAPHPDIRQRCGDRICTVRMITLVDRNGPRLFRSIWKIATGASMADNYWVAGNLVAPVDPKTGVVGRSGRGIGRDFRYVDEHPDTRQKLPGFELPDWQTAVALCLSATSAIPRLPMQAWDIALTARGPLLLEVNVNGGMHLPQMCTGEGIYRGEFVEFLKGFGYPPRHQTPHGLHTVEAAAGTTTATP